MASWLNGLLTSWDPQKKKGEDLRPFSMTRELLNEEVTTVGGSVMKILFLTLLVPISSIVILFKFAIMLCVLPIWAVGAFLVCFEYE